MRPDARRLERVEAWGMSSSSAGYVYRPTDISGILDAYKEAADCELLACFRGGGNSYGDAFQCTEGVVIDLSRMNRLLSWDSETGVLICEPGMTIREIWRHVLPDGWWPPVVSGTSFVTMGGALAANIHGKNNYLAGPIGEHILELDLATPSGELLTCSPDTNSELFYASIGGFGMFGAIVRLAIQMHRIHSGQVQVTAMRTRNWSQTFSAFETLLPASDYLVAWIDCFASGSASGRSLIHSAKYYKEGDDPHPEESLRLSAQELPDTVFGWIARSKMHKLMRPFVRPLGMRLVNSMKFWAAGREHGKIYPQSLAKFNFLLDSAPNWKHAYKPGWLVQFQCFIESDKAESTFEKIVALSQGRGFSPFLGVMKKHRNDKFLLSHAVDGYSLALDYRITSRSSDAAESLFRLLDETVTAAGGKYYLAKDSVLPVGCAERIWGEQAVRQALSLKRQVDSGYLLQSDQFRRVFGQIPDSQQEYEAGERDESPELSTGSSKMNVEEE